MRAFIKDLINFDIYVMDLCESVKPTSCSELEQLADELHQRVEMAIQDYIQDNEKLDIDDYEPSY